MKSLIHKKQALISALLAGLTLLNPATADEQKTQNSINVETSEEISKISVKYWYVSEIDSTSTQEATKKMRWHSAIPNSQVQQESKFVCDSNLNH